MLSIPPYRNTEWSAADLEKAFGAPKPIRPPSPDAPPPKRPFYPDDRDHALRTSYAIWSLVLPSLGAACDTSLLCAVGEAFFPLRALCAKRLIATSPATVVSWATGTFESYIHRNRGAPMLYWPAQVAAFEAGKANALQLLRYLVNNRSDQLGMQRYQERSMVLAGLIGACAGGKLQTARWLVRYFPGVLNPCDERMREAYVLALVNDHPGMAEWLCHEIELCNPTGNNIVSEWREYKVDSLVHILWENIQFKALRYMLENYQTASCYNNLSKHGIFELIRDSSTPALSHMVTCESLRGASVVGTLLYLTDV